MKIIKYLFLLLLLAIIGLSVYIGTQNGAYKIKNTSVIKVPKEIVFNYINDYRNWDQWLDLDTDSTNVKFTFGENTIGQDGFFTWQNGSEEGKFQSIFVKQNDSIAQKMTVDGNTSDSYLVLKDTLGGTKLTWVVEGKADFGTKIKAAFNGGIVNLKSKMFQNSLNNINALITREIKNFSIQVIGEVKIDSVYYAKQTATVKTKDLNSKVTPMLQKIQQFFKNGNLTMNGKPFIIYENINHQEGTITFSVCGPLKEEIFVSDPSDISIAKLEPFTALKTTLKGDYSHRNQAVKKAMAFIAEKKINTNTALRNMDIYTVNVADEKRPSKWVTEILIPIYPKPVAPILVTPPTLSAEDTTME